MSKSPSSKISSRGRRGRKCALLRRDGYRCFWCRIRLNTSIATVDHAVPISQGGVSGRENCVVACEVCNKSRSKINFTEHELMELRKMMKLHLSGVEVKRHSYR